MQYRGLSHRKVARKLFGENLDNFEGCFAEVAVLALKRLFGILTGSVPVIAEGMPSAFSTPVIVLVENPQDKGFGFAISPQKLPKFFQPS